MSRGRMSLLTTSDVSLLLAKRFWLKNIVYTICIDDECQEKLGT